TRSDRDWSSDVCSSDLSMPRKRFVALVVFALVAVLVVPVPAQDAKVTIAMSGWTGFAPLSLAEKAGLFRKHGVDATIKFIPQKRSEERRVGKECRSGGG